MSIDPTDEANQLVDQLNDLYEHRESKTQSTVNQKAKILFSQLSEKMAMIHDPNQQKAVLDRLAFQLNDWDILKKNLEISLLYHQIISNQYPMKQALPSFLSVDMGSLDLALINLAEMDTPSPSQKNIDEEGALEALFSSLALFESKDEPSFELSSQQQGVIHRSQEVLNESLDSEKAFSFLEGFDLLFRNMVTNGAIKEFTEAIEKLPSDIQFLFEDLSPSTNYFEFMLTLEQAKHRTVSLRSFIDQSEKFLFRNKDTLHRQLVQAELIEKSEEIEKITCSPLSSSSKRETHNEGKSPLLVTIELKGGKEKHFVLKPRNSIVECAVLALCGQLKEFKLFQNLLPSYFIYSFQKSNKEWNWESCDALEEFSLWEYIDGTDLRDLGCSPFKGIDIFLGGCEWLEPNDRKILQQKYTAMKSLFKQMHITDLHPENFMLRGVRLNPKISSSRKEEIKKSIALNQDPRLTRDDLIIDPNLLDIVPIDLESVDTHTTASKSIDNEFTRELTSNPQMSTLIKEFTENVNTIPVRYIIIGTELLSLLIFNFNDSQRLYNEIANEGEKRFQKVHKDNLKQLIELSYFYRDVPYFTLLEDRLYYGDKCEERYLIAEGFKKQDSSKAKKIFQSLPSLPSITEVDKLKELALSYTTLIRKVQSGKAQLSELLNFQDQLIRAFPSMHFEEEVKIFKIMQDGIEAMTAVAISSSPISKSDQIFVNPSYEYNGERYYQRATSAEKNACAIHAILGENIDGIYRYNGDAKKYYTDALIVAINIPSLDRTPSQTRALEAYSDSIRNYLTAEDPGANMLFSSKKGIKLKAQWQLISAEFEKRIQESRLREGNLWLSLIAHYNSPYLDLIMDDVQAITDPASRWYQKDQRDVLRMLQEDPALIIDFVYQQQSPNPFLALLEYSGFRHAINAEREKRQGILEKRHQVQDALVFSPEMVKNYVATVNTHAFYLDTNDIKVVASLFDRTVVLFEGLKATEGEVINGNHGIGDPVVIQHFGAHFSRCVKNE